jgi:hypothetical protein
VIQKKQFDKAKKATQSNKYKTLDVKIATHLPKTRPNQTKIKIQFQNVTHVPKTQSNRKNPKTNQEKPKTAKRKRRKQKTDQSGED